MGATPQAGYRISGPGADPNDSRLILSHHYETSAFIGASPEKVFAYADDQARFSSHMSRSSWRMGGGEMKIELDKGQGKQIGSRIRLSGRMLGIALSVETIVIERTPHRCKVWQTTDKPKLLVIGPYRMGFEIASQANGSVLRVFIDYDLPEDWPNRWLGWLLGPYYAKWCTRTMVDDAVRHFAAIGN